MIQIQCALNLRMVCECVRVYVPSDSMLFMNCAKQTNVTSVNTHLIVIEQVVLLCLDNAIRMKQFVLTVFRTTTISLDFLRDFFWIQVQIRSTII